MKTKIIEGTSPDGLYLKAAVSTFEEHEWARPSIVGREYGAPTSLLRQESWDQNTFQIQDLSRPGPGALFQMGNSPMDASWQLKKLPVTF